MITNSDIDAASGLLAIAKSLCEGSTRDRTIALARDFLSVQPCADRAAAPEPATPAIVPATELTPPPSPRPQPTTVRAMPKAAPPPPPPAEPPPIKPAVTGDVINDTMPGVKIGRLAVARDDGRCVKITERQSRLLCALAAAAPNPVGLDFICRKICDQAVPPGDKAPLLSSLAGEINSKIEPLGLFVKIVKGVGASLQWIEGEP